MVSVFAEATKFFLGTVSNEYGNGPAAGIKALRWWLSDEADCFNPVELPNTAGTLDPDDKSNNIFRKGEVVDRLKPVLDRIQEWGAERTKTIR